MATEWEKALERWREAGLLEVSEAERIRNWEAARGPSKPRWALIASLAFGGMLVAAGVLLFVSAWWPQLSPAQRVALTSALIVLLHGSAALTRAHAPTLSLTLHAAGTAALGAALRLTARIHGADEDGPAVYALWAAGAAVAWALHREWPQQAWTAFLAPVWFLSQFRDDNVIWPVGIVLTAIVYLSAPSRVLFWIGAIALYPATLAASGVRDPGAGSLFGWTVAIGAPMALALFIRRKDVLIYAGWAAWAVALAYSTVPWIYLLCAAGAAGMVAWGVRDRRTERINLGIGGFAVTVLAFCSANFLDTASRSLSLIAMGLVFLASGWLLERWRRRLVAGVTRS